jgi:hypothetical protein
VTDPIRDNPAAEWQPARFVRVHPRTAEQLRTAVLKNGALIHVREIDPNNPRIVRNITLCEPARIFYVKETGHWTCEHEILTD